MRSSAASVVAAALLAMAPAGPAAAGGGVLVEPGSPACEAGRGPALQVRVHGFKDRRGLLRVQLYPDSKTDFMASGKWTYRLDVPVTPSGDMTVCLPLQAAGSAVVAVLHDRDSNHRLSPFADGAGFSNNPRLGLGKPPFERVRVDLGPGVTRLDVVLNYLHGLSVRPVARPS